MNEIQSTSLILNKWVIITVVVLSILGATINNLVSEDAVDWIGSPPVLEKPEDL